MTAKKVRALQALLTHSTQAEAAKAAGVGVSTLKRYLNDIEFYEAYQKAVSGLIAAAADQAKQSISPALTVMREIMEDSSQNGQIRISAARSLLEYSLKLDERESVLRRLDELEKSFGGDTYGKH